MWLAALLPPLFMTSIVALALSDAETPRRIKTLSHESSAEQQFDRRCLKLQRIGCVAVGLAFIVIIAVGIEF
jgi:hypothetical protein